MHECAHQLEKERYNNRYNNTHRVLSLNYRVFAEDFLKKRESSSLAQGWEKWENLRNFWNNRPLAEKTQLASEKADVLLEKGIVKRFFNEKK